MNWKLIFQLSIFGLVMAFGTISLIAQQYEPAFWLPVFIFCAYIIAKRVMSGYFLTGFMVGVFNCFWISVIHFIFYQTYIAKHPDMVTMSKSMPASMQIHPRLITTISGLFIGLISCLVLGLFAFIASKIVKKDVMRVEV